MLTGRGFVSFFLKGGQGKSCFMFCFCLYWGLSLNTRFASFFSHFFLPGEDGKILNDHRQKMVTLGPVGPK